MDYNFVKITDFVEKSVKSCKCLATHGFIPDTNFITVRVYENDGVSEFNENREYSNYIEEIEEIVLKLLDECGSYIKRIHCVVPTEFQKRATGGVDYREIVIVPKE